MPFLIIAVRWQPMSAVFVVQTWKEFVTEMMATKEEQISQGIQGAVQVFRRVDKIPIGKRTKEEFK